MTFTDFGLNQLGSFVAGQSPSPPNYVAFGFSGSAFNNSQAHLGSEFYRKVITWAYFNNRPQGNVTLTSAEGNGSNIQEFGIGVGSVLGSNIYARNLTAIGPKNNTFDVDISFGVLFRRG